MPSAFIYNNQTTIMKKKRITYGVTGMMEYQAIIKIGRATLKVMFTDGSMTSLGQNPAKYTTSDFLVQHAIENSSDFKRGRITVVNTIELDEEVKIERNPVKASVQTAVEDKPSEASLSLSKPVAGNEAGNDASSKGTSDEPAEEANAGEAEPAEETAAKEEAASDNEAEATTEEAGTADGKTEVEFSTNQEAKDYLANTFGVKTPPKTRAEIIAVGETYGVKITFANN